MFVCIIYSISGFIKKNALIKHDSIGQHMDTLSVNFYTVFVRKDAQCAYSIYDTVIIF